MNITGTVAAPGFSGLYYGSSGSGYPYNTTNSQGKLSAGPSDTAPLTPNKCAGYCIDGVLLLLNGDSANVSYAYSPSPISVTADSGAGTQAIYLNGTQAGTASYSAVLAAGTYNFTANTSASANYSSASATYFATVSKAASTLALSAPNWTVLPGIATNVTCSVGNGQTPIYLYRNGALVASSTGGSVSDAGTLPSGAYNYVCNSSDSQNYTAAAQVTNTLYAGVTHCGASIDAAGGAYALGSNQTYPGATCFVVGAQNVTIDCAGYSITGDNSIGFYGIYSGYYNTTVKNCVISGYPDASVLFNGSASSSVQGSTLGAASAAGGGYYTEDPPGNATGILVSNSSNVSITDTVVAGLAGGTGSDERQPEDTTFAPQTGGDAHGVLLVSSPGAHFRNVTLKGNIGGTGGSTTGITCDWSGANGGIAYGIYGTNSSGGTFSLVNASGNNGGEPGQDDACGNGPGAGGDVDGIYLEYSPGSAITGATASSNIGGPDYGNGAGIDYGIALWANSSGSTISGFTGYPDAGYGIYVGSSDNTIANSTSSSDSYAISVIVNNMDWLGSLASNNVLSNVTASSDSGNAITVSASNATFINSAGTSSSGSGFYASGSENGTATGCRFSSGTNTGLSLSYSSNFVFTNVSATSNSSVAAYFYGVSGTTITGSLISGKSTDAPPYGSPGAFLLYYNGQNNTIANSTINGNGGDYALVGATGSNTGNVFANNTIMNAGSLVYLGTYSGNNTFYWNNFTNASGLYVNDTNGSNYFNATISGKGEGNIWPGLSLSNFTAYPPSSYGQNWHAGTAGNAYPYNSTTSGRKVVPGVIDYAPLFYYAAPAPPPTPAPHSGSVTGGGEVYIPPPVQQPGNTSGAPAQNQTQSNVSSPPAQPQLHTLETAFRAVRDAEAALNAAAKEGKDISQSVWTLSAAKDALAIGDYAEAERLAALAVSQIGAKALPPGTQEPSVPQSPGQGTQAARPLATLAMIAGAIILIGAGVYSYMKWGREKGG
ncbi:Right handed beta helix region [uncultured archaeon]|nr:Right handed beta helix region [uncultured archaeon]